MAFVRNNLNNVTSGAAKAPRMWAYQSTDTLAATVAEAYFNEATELKVGDMMQVNATDAFGLYFVQAVGTVVLVGAAAKAEAVIVHAGTETTVGGNAVEAFTVAGALATDLAFIQVINNGTNNVTVLQAEVTAADTMTVTFSGDPAADTVIAYQLLRAL